MAAAFLLLALLTCTTYLASAHPIVVDGSSADWMSGRDPLAPNTGLVARNAADHGVYVWLDAGGDERTDLNGSAPDPRVDITRVRYTGTPASLNVLVNVADLPTASGSDTAQGPAASSCSPRRIRSRSEVRSTRRTAACS